MPSGGRILPACAENPADSFHRIFSALAAARPGGRLAGRDARHLKFSFAKYAARMYNQSVKNYTDKCICIRETTVPARERGQ